LSISRLAGWDDRVRRQGGAPLSDSHKWERRCSCKRVTVKAGPTVAEEAETVDFR
jgi:hypothetical protein